MKIRIEKLKKFVEESYGVFDPKAVVVEPYDYGLKSCMISELEKSCIDEAIQKASEIDEVCVGFVTNPAGEEFIISSKPSWDIVFVLFNAEKASSISAEMRTVTHNKGKGALTAYMHDQRISYKKDSLLIF